MEQIEHRLFKIDDGTDIIVFVPTSQKVYRVTRDVAATLPDYVVGPGIDVAQLKSKEEPEYAFTEATLILTNQCRLGCIYCFGGYVPRPKEPGVMSLEIVHAVVDHLVESAKRSGKKQIRAGMFGGEPTLPWDTLVEAVQYLRLQALENDLMSLAGITTNGCVRLQRARWLANSMDRILLSIDGPEDIHNAQRNGSFARVFSTAKEIYRISPRKLKLRATVSAASVNRLPEIARFFGENFPGCTQHYEPLFAMGRAKANPLAQPPDASLFFEKFMEALGIAKALGTRIRTSITGAWRVVGVSFCGAAGRNFVVNYDGAVVSCHRMAEADVNEAAEFFTYGQFDLLEKRFVFDDEKHQSLTQLTVTRIPSCRDCFVQYGCKGDCLANKAVISPQSFWEERSYRCEAIKEFTKVLLRYALDYGVEELAF